MTNTCIPSPRRRPTGTHSAHQAAGHGAGPQGLWVERKWLLRSEQETPAGCVGCCPVAHALPWESGVGAATPPQRDYAEYQQGRRCLAQRTSKRHSLPERCWFHSRLRKRRARGARGAWAHSPSTPSASHAPAGSPTHKIVPPGAARGRLGCRGVKYDMRWGAGNGH